MTDNIDPYPVPNPEWTPKQEQNWNDYMANVYDELETELGRTWYRRCWRPKQRNEGKLKRDHVEFGTPEDYIIAHVEDHFEPMGSMMGVMMRSIGKHRDNDELEEAISDIVRAKLRVMAENNPARARRLLDQTKKVTQLYGVTGEKA